MALRRGFLPRRTSGTKRSTDWGLGPGSSTAVTSFSTSVSKIIGSGVTPTNHKLTIVRLRGEFTGALLTAAAAGTGFIGALGVGVVTNAAFAIGPTAVPDPIADMEWDGWMYHRFFSCLSGGVIDGGAAADHDQVNGTYGAFRYDVDSKAMRKIDEEEILVAIVGLTEIGACTMDIRFDSRLLLKLG